MTKHNKDIGTWGEEIAGKWLACPEHYAAGNEIDHWQIDVMAIEGKPPQKPVITYFENAIG